MERKRLTRKEANAAARDFMDRFIKPGRQWTVNSLHQSLPFGWRLRNDTTEDQFMPPSIGNMADAFQQCAVRE